MIQLLFIVVICGLAAWVIQALSMPEPFRTIAFAVLVLIVVVAFFQLVLGVGVFPRGSTRIT